MNYNYTEIQEKETQEIANQFIKIFNEESEKLGEGAIPLLELKMGRESVNEIAHNMGLSKVLFLEKLQKTINSMLNKNNVFSIYQFSPDGYEITIAHWDAFSDCGKDYLKSFVINN